MNRQNNRPKKDDALEAAIRNDPEILRSLVETTRQKLELEKLELKNQEKAITLRSKEVELNAETAHKAIQAQKEVLINRDNGSRHKFNWFGWITLVVVGVCGFLVYAGHKDIVIEFAKFTITPAFAFFGGKAIGERKGSNSPVTRDSVS